MNSSYANSENEYKGLTVERIKREEVFKCLSDKEAEIMISVLEKYSINMFPAFQRSLKENEKI